MVSLLPLECARIFIFRSEHGHFILSLSDLSSLSLSRLTSAASSTMSQLKEQTTSGLQGAIQNRKVILTV